MTMIITWLIELYLNQIGELKDRGSNAKMELEGIVEEFRKLLVQSRVKVSECFFIDDVILSYDCR